MNLRNVLRAYSLLRQLSDDESALLNILRTLNDNDREQLVASMSDKPQKKSSKKAAGGGGRSSKSARASGMAAAISSSLESSRKAAAAEFCGKCGTPEDRPAHHDHTTSDYHEFQPPASSAAGSGG